ncbi:hypothetical protein K469DRAFT_689521 [Zopfia rhizophila CBS 207.26]|uniref:Rhodopsin domain-containing protein n=1 Tax=Zopfia rhizophila CBS 207.26 TaxID=1314779 RepID=A0A6A6E2S0_9PEZI|nr:hypothetical protein K469DRAFT_689521 [Zopfia rhizophila CBS 207.26]
MTIAVAICIYTQAVVKKSLGVDDHLAERRRCLLVERALSIAAGTLGQLSSSYGLLFIKTKYGFDMHMYLIPASEILDTLKWLTLSQISYFLTVIFIKLCILIGYNRMFKIDPITKWLVWVGVFGLSVVYIVIFFLDLFRCNPIEIAWNPTIKGKCVSYTAFP